MARNTGHVKVGAGGSIILGSKFASEQDRLDGRGLEFFALYTAGQEFQITVLQRRHKVGFDTEETVQ